MILHLLAAVSASGVAHVVDGDTLQVGGVRVRLSGVDAPELSQRCGAGTSSVACGEVAARWLRSRVEGRRVDCQGSERDRYDRLVAVCRMGGADLGGAMVDAGWATAYRRYSLAYVAREEAARQGRRGIWAMGFEAPADYRRDRRLAAPQQPPPNPGCVIKGNVSRRDERIYHLPGSRDYASVRISPARGERWFCSVQEAVAAGWRPAR